MVIFSAELVFGPVDAFVSISFQYDTVVFDQHTNGADDAGSAVILLWQIVDVEIALPFQLRAVGEMVQCVTHFVLFCFLFFFLVVC